MGQSENLDPRLFAYREDLTDIRLKGRIDAPCFVEGRPMQVMSPSLTMRRRPGFDSPQDCELIRGDRVHVFDNRDGWAWVQNIRDDYVGYVPTDGLSESIVNATHSVIALSSFVFPEPSLKLHPISALPLTATVRIVETGEKYSRIQGEGWIYNRHIAPIGVNASDPVSVARMFMGVPYYWGGNTSYGIDCSGLVQIALRRCGYEVPRDSCYQEEAIGAPVEFDGRTNHLRRGDLVFWPGHVGFYEGDGLLLHANATDMMVSSSPLDAIRDHIKNIENNDISGVRRLS